MDEKTYTTKEIADLVGIHVNTVRLYEKIGFITKPERLSNGWRKYTELQLEECRLIRKAMRAEVLQNGLREKAVEIVRLCAGRNFEKAGESAKEYLCMIDSEIHGAKAAAKTVENILRKKPSENRIALKRSEAAKKLRVTAETLRTWERSGLLSAKRGENGYRVYDSENMERLNIIRVLRCANYSLSAILRLLNALEKNTVCSVEAALNTPTDEEDIISVCDRLVVSLKNTKKDAAEIAEDIEKMKQKFLSLQ